MLCRAMYSWREDVCETDCDMVVRHRQDRDCYQEKLLLVQVRVEFQGATEKKVPVQVRSVDWVHGQC